MSWEFQKHDVKVFERNPLKEALAQVQYKPQLSIESGLGEIQRRVREMLPEATVRVSPAVASNDGGVNVNLSKAHWFGSSDGAVSVNVTSTQITAQSLIHVDRGRLGDALGLMAAVVKDVVGFVPEPTRFGVRYVNHIDLELVAEQLNRNDLVWSDLINAEYLLLPNMEGLHDVTHQATTEAGFRDGRLRVQRGLGSVGARRIFVLDVDRSRGPGFAYEACDDLFNQYADEVYSVFRSVVSDELTRWMSMPKGEK